MIRVTTDDMVHAEEVLQSIAGKSNSAHIDSLTATALYKADTVLYTTNPKVCTPDNYELLDKKEKTLIFLNVEPNALYFDAGVLVPPASLVQKLVQQYVQTDLTHVLTGLDLKAVDELLRLTSVKFGNLQPVSIKTMRAMLGVPIQGLYPVETDMGFYHPYEPLKVWATLNRPYFLAKGINPVLRPRGILLDGLPGTGKTAASKYLASKMGVPLYRLDVATSLNKYIGESEIRLMRILRQLEEYAPCVVLIDEVEKVFVKDQDNGVMQRMMSQLLWWLSEHRSQVLTVMTTNDRSKIPPELFREGRINDTLTIPPMTASNALILAQEYLKSILGPKLTLKHTAALQFKSSETYTAVWVINYVVSLIKENGWGVESS
jgi:hypothetical protein